MKIVGLNVNINRVEVTRPDKDYVDGDDDGEEEVELVGGPFMNPGPAVHHRYTDQTTWSGNCFEWKLINFELCIFGLKFPLYIYLFRVIFIQSVPKNTAVALL